MNYELEQLIDDTFVIDTRPTLYASSFKYDFNNKRDASLYKVVYCSFQLYISMTMSKKNETVFYMVRNRQEIRNR